MRKFFSAVLIAALGAAAASSASADQVVTNVGDQLSGTITSITDGNLTLHSDALGGDVVIPMSHVRTFQTSTPVSIRLADGTMIHSRLAASDPGDVALVGENDGKKLDITSIESVNVPAFSGSFQLGGSLTRGNTFTDTLNAGFNVGYKVQNEQFTVTGEYSYGRQKDRTTDVSTTSTDRWDVDAKYQHFFTKKFYGFLEAELTRDRIAFLDLRFTPSAGVGYQWLDQGPLKLGTEGGIAWLYEKYTNGTSTREDVAAKLAYHLTYDFNPSVNLFNDVTYIPSLEHGSFYLINADIGIHTKLTTKLFAEVKIEWDYDSSPAIGALKNDERYIASLGYSL